MHSPTGGSAGGVDAVGCCQGFSSVVVLPKVACATRYGCRGRSPGRAAGLRRPASALLGLLAGGCGEVPLQFSDAGLRRAEVVGCLASCFVGVVERGFDLAELAVEFGGPPFGVAGLAPCRLLGRPGAVQVSLGAGGASLGGRLGLPGLVPLLDGCSTLSLGVVDLFLRLLYGLLGFGLDRGGGLDLLLGLFLRGLHVGFHPLDPAVGVLHPAGGVGDVAGGLGEPLLDRGVVLPVAHLVLQALVQWGKRAEIDFDWGRIGK